MSFCKKIFSKKYLPFWLLLIIFLASSWPLLQPGMFKIHDFTHGARVAEMLRSLQNGYFPVRWSQNFGFGYGMPLFQFYAPLPFYIGAVFYWLSNQLLLSVKLLFLLANGLTLIGAYLLGKKLFNSQIAALVTAFALTLAPYRFLNLYVRGALSELWAIMALPWIVWSALKVINQDKWGWLWLTSSAAVLFLSHNISTLIYSPLLCFLILFFLVKEKCCFDWHERYHWPNLNWQNLKQRILNPGKKLLRSGVLAAGLSFFYLAPAYFEKELTQVENFILDNYFDFRIHFLYVRQFFKPNWGYGGSEYGPDDPITFFLGYGQLLLLLISLVLVLNLVRKLLLTKLGSLQEKNIYSTLTLISGLLLLLFFSLFLTLSYSQFIWEAGSILEFVQFPWRFLGISVLFLALVSGWAAQQINDWSEKFLLNRFNSKKKIKLCLSAALLLPLALNLRFAAPDMFLDNAVAYYYADAKKIRREMSYVLPDYIPQGFDLNNEPVATLIINQNDLPADNFQVVTDKIHYKEIETNFNQPQQLQLAIADYPFWQAVSTQPTEELLQTQDGFLVLNVPPGEQTIGVKLTATNLRTASDVISLTSVLIVLILILYQSKLLTFVGHKIYAGKT